MTFWEHLKDKFYFIVFFFFIMFFISVNLIVSVEPTDLWQQLIYINVSCILFAFVYLISSYYYKCKFYNHLKVLTQSRDKDAVSLLPKATNFEQGLYIALLKKIVQDHQNQLQTFKNQKKEQEEFVISWVHEIKLPITASRLLLESTEEKSVDYLADKFEDELNKIENYVEQALYYSRIDSFSKDYFITDIDINQIVKNSVKKYSKLFINQEISLNMNSDEFFIQSDKKWLGFIVDQLLANSLKYTLKGGMISVYFEESCTEKRLTIHDNGIGITPEDINRVFERGFTGTNGRSHARSTGMGLFFAKQMANKLGHQLSIESTKDEFTKVTIHFPKIRNYQQI